MTIEIATERRINVHRPDRDFLLKVKAGDFEYKELLTLAQKKQVEMERAFAESTLSEQPDLEYIAEVVYESRKGVLY